MYALAQLPPNEAQPGNSGVSGLGHRPLHVEMKNRFGTAGPFLGQPPPAGAACARAAVSHHAVANEIDVDVLVGRPMALEIVEEGGPVRLEAVHLKIAQWEREAVVDTDQRRHVLSQLLCQPFGDFASSPVFA